MGCTKSAPYYVPHCSSHNENVMHFGFQPPSPLQYWQNRYCRYYSNNLPDVFSRNYAHTKDKFQYLVWANLLSAASVCEYTAYIYILYSIFQFNFISIAAIHNNSPLSAPYIVRYSPQNNREKTTRITQSPGSKNSMVGRQNSFLGQRSLPGNRNY